jgi:hypothetical protein
MTGFIVLFLSFSLSLYWLFKGGFYVIKKIKPKKKKEDCFDWDKDLRKVAGRDSWNDNLYEEIF